MIVFSDTELKSIEEFESEHLHLKCYRNLNSKQKYAGFTIHQSWETGIGVNTTITCDCCGETKDITDYDCW